jgi:phosphoribosylaminoimidazolecarboxamide formyltransferase / IMP cyclohydrolase
LSSSISRALITVSDKSGIADLGKFLQSRGVEILSTGGTAAALTSAGVAVREVSEHTGYPEIMDGRVKTLHPTIAGGVLAVRENPGHVKAMEDHAIAPIDLVVVNLYPFQETVAGGGTFAECIENIDIGGPTLIRAAAKNHGDVAVVVDPGDYSQLIEEMSGDDTGVSAEFREHLAAKAFARVAAYDGAIAAWFAARKDGLPTNLVATGTQALSLRYGENPHQQAALYATDDKAPGVVSARQIQGKALSYNNIADADAALALAAELGSDRPAIAIIKHANPCGVALGDTLSQAYANALRCDPVSAFGGIVAANMPLDGAAATEIAKIFTEVVIAPDADAEALEIFAGKKNLRVLLTGSMPVADRPGLVFRSIAGGILAQSKDTGTVGLDDLKVVTKRQPSDDEMRDLMFAWSVAKHVKSNAIIFAKNAATTAIGAGQMSRLDSARIAARKSADAAKAVGEAQPLTVGSVAASDAFFPFADGLDSIAEAGATAVIQPGGSMRDDEVIAAADAADLGMVFTGMRHFRH